MKLFNGTVAGEAGEADSVFVINDIALRVPPTSISIRKEDMVWQWKTLRTKTSTKIPSGRGVVQVSVRLIFVPQHFLEMHRLITQFKHSPFCYIENALIRDSIVPDWLNTQMMAFTMTGLNIQNMTGSPGTFILDLDLRWFNYAPYAINWLYRDEYATKPIGEDGAVKTIETYGPGLKKMSNIIDFLPQSSSALDSYEVLSGTKDIVGGFTMDDLLFNHAGTAFDLLPRPTDVMRKAKPVTPHLSNIYKRYINTLQQKALFHNFGVDIAKLVRDQEPTLATKRAVTEEEVAGIDEQFTSKTITLDAAAQPGGLVVWEQFTTGIRKFSTTDSSGKVVGINVVDSLHSSALPESVRQEVIIECLKFCRDINFLWHQYIIDQKDPELQKALSQQVAKSQEAVAKEHSARARLLDNLAVTVSNGGSSGSGYTGLINTKSIAEVTHTTKVAREDRQSYGMTELKKRTLALIPTKFETDQRDMESGEPPYLFSAVLEDVTELSGFGMRELNGKVRNHAGIDIVSSSTKVYAPFDGTLTIRSANPYNTVDKRVGLGVNTVTGNNDGEDRVGENSRKSYLSRVDLINGADNSGIHLKLISSSFQGYSADFHHMGMIGESGKVGDTQVARFYTSESDGNKYGGIEILQESIQVKRGQLIGEWGNTGGSGGPHLHFEVRKDGTAYDPYPFMIARDVSEMSEDELVDQGLTSEGLPEPLPPPQVPDTSFNMEEDVAQSYGTDSVLAPETETESPSVVISKELKKEFEEKENTYLAEGFVPYEDMQDVTNVRKRTVRYSFYSENNNLFPGIVPDFVTDRTIDMPAPDNEFDDTHVFSLKGSDNMVITNVIGSLSHVVASIPLLGQEFPTHQHLGSIEPSYTIEFVTQADNLFNDNLSAEGALLELMRSTLQRNARDFRPIPDSYAVSTDHFITRLFGTYRTDDINLLKINNEFNDTETLLKRTLINRVSTQTVEGHPGLSSIQISLVETNPYQTEELSIESNSSEDERGELIKEVLHRLYRMNLTPEGKVQSIVEEYAADIYTEEDDIATKLEAAGLKPSAFGKKSWDEVKEVAVLTATDEYYYSLLGTMNDDWSGNVDPSPFTEESKIGEETAWEVLRDLQEAAAEVDITLYGKYHEEIKTPTDATTAFPSRESSATTTDFFVDMTDFYTVYPELKPNSTSGLDANQLNLNTRHKALKELIRSASVCIAEQDVGLPSSAVTESFYDLPVEQEMMSCFVYFFTKYLEELSGATNYTSGSEDLANSVNIPAEAVQDFLTAIKWNTTYKEPSKENKDLIDNSIEEIVSGSFDLSVALGELLEFTTFVAYDDTSILADQAEMLEDFKSAVRELAEKYVDFFVKFSTDKESLGMLESVWSDVVDMAEGAASWLSQDPGEVKQLTAYDTTASQIDYLLNWLFSPDLLGQIDNKFFLQFYKFVKSTSSGAALASWTVGVLTLLIGAIATADPVLGDEVMIAGAGASILSAIRVAAARLAAKLATKKVAMATVGFGGLAGGGSHVASQLVDGTYSESDENTAAYQFLVNGSASIPIEEFITKDIEAQKVSFYRAKLNQLAESIISSPALLAALGIRTEEYTLRPMLNEWVGTPCYPDLELPEHPYYIGTHSYAMSPDFYMWSPYEDGTMAIKDEIKRIIEDGVEKVINNSYSFMKQMQVDGIKAVRDGGMELNNSLGNTTPKILNVLSNPEGADQVKQLKRDAEIKKLKDPFAPLTLLTSKGTEDIWDMTGVNINSFSMDQKVEKRAWEKLIEVAGDEEVKKLGSAKKLGGGVVPYMEENTDFTDPATYVNGLAGGAPVLALSGTDGNVQYLGTSTEDAVYNQYFSKVQDISKMFGSRQGYLGDEVTKDNAAEIVKEIGDTALASISEAENWYSRAGIEQIVKHSSADIVSEKMTLKRAYPTFKLYFVEEDEQESRWLNLDDFYSFNAVKEFNFYQSRTEASSTATIVLQNIAGTLDGTRRGAIVDLDYFSKKAAGEIEEDKNVEVLADNKQHVASKDQPFDAIVLRPGMNVQLRVGYSNDPNMLHVLLNGRVVDVQWNMTGDLTEITVQSFGTELTQTKKGIGGNDYSVNWDDKIYYTTHQLLGSLMMDRDLKHFGRWEFGRLSQIGEDNNADLDFYPYEDEGFLGGMPLTKWVFDLFTDHPWRVGVAIGALGLLILTRGKGSKLFTGTIGGGSVGRVLHKIPVAGRLFARGKLGYQEIAGAAGAISRSNSSAQIWKALGAGSSKKVTAALAEANITLSATLRSNVDKMVAAMHGLSGGARATQIARLRQLSGRLRIPAPLTGPVQSGAVRGRQLSMALEAEASALARWQSVSRWIYYPRFGFSQFKTWAGLKSNAWALTKVTLGNAFLKPFSNTLGVGISAITGAAAVDVVGINTGFYSFAGDYIKSIKKKTKRINARLKLTPADDNIFAPSPATYMTLRSIQTMAWSGKAVGYALNELLAQTFSINVVDIWKESQSIINPQDIDPQIFEKRVLPTACQYKVHASTIWEVFEEMTLRHPGWIWGTRPYGTEFRDTMFFGTPSQRYWSKPASTAFVLRMNKLYEYIQRTGETEEIIKKQIVEVYGTDIAEKMLEESSRIDMQVAYDSMTGSRESIPTTVDLLKNKFRVALMDEWLKGMEQRFEPFRRYHLITSERDIISNNIICSEHSVINSVQVAHTKLDNLGRIKEMERDFVQMKAHSLIPDHMLNTGVVDKYNCNSYKMALRYGQASMIYGLKQMYKGEVSLLGNARIRPWDVCILADSYNDMSGPIEVESVVHMFSHETGFITEIKPNALVIGNEIATFPILEAMKLYAMAKVDLENNSVNPDASRTFGETPQHPPMQDHFNEKYKSIFQQSANGYIDELNDAIDQQKYLRNIGSIEGANLSDTSTLVDREAQWTIGKGLAGAALTAVAGVAAATGAAKIPQLLNVTGRGAGIAKGIAGLGGGISGGAAAGSFLLPDKQGIIQSAAGYIGSKLLFAQCMEQETIMVIPILKGRRPVVSGMTLKNPSDIFESILGSVSNVMEDGIMGTRDMFNSWKDYKTASWMQVDGIIDERNDFLGKMYANHQIFYNWKDDYRVD